jgi:hypothetical protein
LNRINFTKASRQRREATRLAEASNKAWEEFLEQAPLAANRISVARRSCERFLAAAKSHPFDTEILAHVVVLQKRVPDMISKHLALGASMEPRRHRQLLEELLDQLESIAAEGERRLAPHDIAPLDELETDRAYLRSYLAQRRGGLHAQA